MYLFYVDETGNLDPRMQIPRKDGTSISGDPIFVITTVGLFEQRWHRFEKAINRRKQEILDGIYRVHQIRLELADFELKSYDVRNPEQRMHHKVLKHLSPEVLTEVVELYYKQLHANHMPIFSVIMDKSKLAGYMDQDKIHRKAWELLLEMVQCYMESMHPKHQALFVKDEMTRESNRNLAMKHAYLLDKGTSSGKWLTHVCEMPHFVRSELSNGVQLADFCSYNIYRVFKNGNTDYPFFKRMEPALWSKNEPIRYPFSGLRVFPPNSDYVKIAEAWEASKTSKTLQKEGL